MQEYVSKLNAVFVHYYCKILRNTSGQLNMPKILSVIVRHQIHEANEVVNTEMILY